MSVCHTEKARDLIAHRMTCGGLCDIDRFTRHMRRTEHTCVIFFVIGKIPVHMLEHEADRLTAVLTARLRTVDRPVGLDRMTERIHHGGLLLVQRERQECMRIHKDRLRDDALTRDRLLRIVIVDDRIACCLGSGTCSCRKCDKRNIVRDEVSL